MLNSIAGILGVGGVANSYESIATATVGAGGSSSITFDLTSVSGYKHLQLRFFGISSASNPDVNLIYNNDTGSNYRIHILRGFGASAQAESYAANAITNLVSGGFAGGVTDIFDYTDTSKNKVARTLVGYDLNGSGAVGLWSHLWTNTAAITSLKLTPSTGNFNQYSSFALYGIKG